MRKLIVLGAVAVAIGLPTASGAQLSLGARIAWAPALGDASKDSPMTDAVTGQVPIQLDASYRLTPGISAGVFLSYGFAQLAGGGCGGCSASVTRLGVQGTYAFTEVSPRLVPWVGLGAGLEWLTLKRSVGGVPVGDDLAGFELVHVQGGVDYALGRQLAAGPYVLFSLGQYTTEEGHAVPAKGLHEWLNLGIRGKFDL